MSMSLVVTGEGEVEAYAYEIDVHREMEKRYAVMGPTRFVSAQLTRDGIEVGVVTFALDTVAFDVNDKATDLTGFLCGAFIEVHGLAIFSGLDVMTGLAALGYGKAVT